MGWGDNFRIRSGFGSSNFLYCGETWAEMRERRERERERENAMRHSEDRYEMDKLKLQDVSQKLVFF